jgi:hypothetical protein
VGGEYAAVGDDGGCSGEQWRPGGPNDWVRGTAEVTQRGAVTEVRQCACSMGNKDPRGITRGSCAR